MAYTRTELAASADRRLALRAPAERLPYVDDQGTHQLYRRRLRVGIGQPGYANAQQVAQVRATIN